ncbi:hypothetical protein EMCRGX_G016588 [Ephydatia muelleri]
MISRENTLLDYFSKIPPTPGQHVESDLVATTEAEARIVESNAHCQTTPVHVENTTEGAHLMKSNAIANHHHNSSCNTSSERDTGTCELGNCPSSDDDHEKSDVDSEENRQFIISEAGYSTNNVESEDEDDVNEDDNCGNSFLCEQEGIDDENITEKDSGTQ